MPLEIDRLRLRILKDKAPQTLKNTLALMRRLINFGMKRRYCLDLSFHLEIPKVNNLKTEDLSPEQLANLLTAIDQDHDTQAANLMRLALCTGMRKSEMFRLKWDDVDSDRGFIHLRAPKAGKDQTIPLNQAGENCLRHHPEPTRPLCSLAWGSREPKSGAPLTGSERRLAYLKTSGPFTA
jgi:integrase